MEQVAELEVSTPSKRFGCHPFINTKRILEKPSPILFWNQKVEDYSCSECSKHCGAHRKGGFYNKKENGEMDVSEFMNFRKGGLGYGV